MNGMRPREVSARGRVTRVRVTCVSGTNTSVTNTSWLPVPRSPGLFQVSMIV